MAISISKEFSLFSSYVYPCFIEAMNEGYGLCGESEIKAAQEDFLRTLLFCNDSENDSKNVKQSTAYSWLSGKRKLPDNKLESIISRLVKPGEDAPRLDDVFEELMVQNPDCIPSDENWVRLTYKCIKHLEQKLQEKFKNDFHRDKKHCAEEIIAIYLVHSLKNESPNRQKIKLDTSHLVGRQKEHSVLQDKLDSENFIIISGPAMSGKTTLAKWYLRDNKYSVFHWDYAEQKSLEDYISGIKFEEDTFFAKITDENPLYDNPQDLETIKFRLSKLSNHCAVLVDNFDGGNDDLRQIYDFGKSIPFPVIVITRTLESIDYPILQIAPLSPEDLRKIFWSYNSDYDCPDLAGRVTQLSAEVHGSALLMTLIAEAYHYLSSCGDFEQADEILDKVLAQQQQNVRQDMGNKIKYNSDLDAGQVNLIGHIRHVFSSYLNKEEKGVFLLCSCLSDLRIPEYYMKKWFFPDCSESLKNLCDKGWCTLSQGVVQVAIPKTIALHLFGSRKEEKKQIYVISQCLETFCREIRNEEYESVDPCLIQIVIWHIHDFLIERSRAFPHKGSERLLYDFHLNCVRYYIQYGSFELADQLLGRNIIGKDSMMFNALNTLIQWMNSSEKPLIAFENNVIRPIFEVHSDSLSRYTDEERLVLLDITEAVIDVGLMNYLRRYEADAGNPSVLFHVMSVQKTYTDIYETILKYSRSAKKDYLYQCKEDHLIFYQEIIKILFMECSPYDKNIADLIAHTFKSTAVINVNTMVKEPIAVPKRIKAFSFIKLMSESLAATALYYGQICRQIQKSNASADPNLESTAQKIRSTIERLSRQIDEYPKYYAVPFRIGLNCKMSKEFANNILKAYEFNSGETHQ